MSSARDRLTPALAVSTLLMAVPALVLFARGGSRAWTMPVLVGAGILGAAYAGGSRTWALRLIAVELSIGVAFTLVVLSEHVIDGVAIATTAAFAIAALVVARLVARAGASDSRRVASAPRAAPGRVVAAVLAAALAAAVLTPLLERAARSATQQAPAAREHSYDKARRSARDRNPNEQLGIEVTSRVSARHGPGERGRSNAVVMRVQAPQGGLMRGQTFDEYADGEWSADGGGSAPRRRVAAGRDGAIALRAPDGEPNACTDAARVSVTQRVYPLVQTSTVLGYAQPCRIEGLDAVTTTGDTVLGSYSDYSYSDYAVTSALVASDDPRLHAPADAVAPAPVVASSAPMPATTDRVVATAKALTDGLATPYAKAVAIEQWIRARVRYSLDAPETPAGADPVDDFLFRSRVGWCTRIATAHAVMLRAAGVPARLATGVAVDEYDRRDGEYVVRGTDAHAWTEVYVGGVGWVTFDPTAGVARAPAPGPGPVARFWPVLVGAGVLLGLGLLVARWRRRPATREPSWVAAQVARLERIGAACGHPRAPSEPVVTFAAALGERRGDPVLGIVGRVLDAAAFGADPLSAADRDAVEAALAAAEAEAARAPARAGAARVSSE